MSNNEKPVIAVDVAGNVLGKGDTVTTLSGGLTAKVCNVNVDFDCAFVQLRPAHQPFAKGVWHAADRVLRLAIARKPGGSGNSGNGKASAGNPRQATRQATRPAADADSRSSASPGKSTKTPAKKGKATAARVRKRTGRTRSAGAKA